MKIKEIVKSIFVAIGIFITGMVSMFFYFRNKESECEKENFIKEKENEIKNKPADEIIANSVNQSDISAAIQAEQSELRERIRNRLNQNL